MIYDILISQNYLIVFCTLSFIYNEPVKMEPLKHNPVSSINKYINLYVCIYVLYFLIVLEKMKTFSKKKHDKGIYFTKQLRALK